MAGTTLTQKLNLKPYHQVLQVNAPEQFTLDEILEGMGICQAPTGSPVDCIHVFIHSKADLETYLPAVLPHLKADGLLWISYPKGTSGVTTDINRDKLWALLETQGWEGVRQVSVDEVWSAMRFKVKERISDKFV